LRKSRDSLRDDLSAARKLIAFKTEEAIEANHRLKNGIQTAMSILNIQADLYADSDDHPEIGRMLTEASKRLGFIARAHDMLRGHAEGVQSVEMNRYLSELCTTFAAAHAPRDIELIVTVEPLALDVRRAVSVALIVVEAVTNAYKHAFPDHRHGSTRVDLRAMGGQVRLSVTDDGIGFADADLPDSLGMRIMRGFSRDLGARIAITGAAGTSVIVTFPR
jgi:two-component sensor histidine kinase